MNEPTCEELKEHYTKALERINALATALEVWDRTFNGKSPEEVQREWIACNEELQKCKAERDAALKMFNEARELHVMQLAGIMTATMQNTKSTIKDRIDHSNPYWTQAYGDVCAAVDREIREREAKDAAIARAEAVEKCCAEIRKVVINLWNKGSDCPGIQSEIEHALSTDSGKDYVNVNELEPIVEWLCVR